MRATILDSRSGVIDALLIDIAKRIQLSPTNYSLAVDRYQTISEYLERDESLFQGHVTRLYPQGSMSIGSVISSKFENDEFDIDIIAELDIHPDTPPVDVLDALFHTLNGEKGSRYFGKVKRCSRCVQVQYESMHLDVTPAVLLPTLSGRTSLIFHANEEETADKHYTVAANPWGFSEWFKEQMHESTLYINALTRKVSEPVPDLELLHSKAKPLIALQLIKRWRNKIYDQRDGKMPPSVMLSCLIAHNTGHRSSLFDELVSNAEYLYKYFSSRTQLGSLVHIENPRCSDDVLTDRWPADLQDQALFTSDLKILTEELQWLSENRTIEGCHKVMARMFGEKPTTLAVQEFAKNYSAKAYSGELYHHQNSGAVALAKSGISSTSSQRKAYSTPKNTFYGED